MQPVEGWARYFRMLEALMHLAFSSLYEEAKSGEYENGGSELRLFRILEWDGCRVGEKGIGFWILFFRILARQVHFHLF